MEVGDYVRTKGGKIGKLIGNDAYDKKQVTILIDDTKDIKITPVIDKEQIIKSSKNIIDLIEVGDYVNGEKVIALRKDISERNIHMNSKDNLIFTDYDMASNWYFGIDTDEIKSIVTKEQFKNMEYRIGD